MNKQELEELVKADKVKIENQINEETRVIFFSVLGVYPDEVDTKKVYEKQDDYHTFKGRKCTLNGAEFYAGNEFWYYSTGGGRYPFVFQKITTTRHIKRWLRKPVEITSAKYIRIYRPADIII